MLLTKDIRLIAHVFIHNPKEVVQDREYVGYFPNLVRKDNLKLVQTATDLNIELSKADTVWLLIPGIEKTEHPEWHHKVYHYINNPDGSIRWIYPRKTDKPYFLRFYSVNNLRSWLISKYYTTLFKFGLKDLARSGSFTIYMRKEAFLSNHYLVNRDNDFCIFTGTVGPNRKAVLFSQNQNEPFFVKIPLTQDAINNTKNEYYQLRNIHNSNQIKKPTALYWEDANYLFLEDVKPKNIKRQTGKLTKAHIRFLHDNLKNAQVKNIQRYDPLTHAYNLLQDAKMNELPMAKRLASHLTQLFQSTFRETGSLLGTLCHGDFTSWNSYSKNNKLYLYDWEFSQPDYPIFYDLFHFIFQQEILVNHNNFKTIKEKIISTLALPEFVNYIQKNNINYLEYLKYYLLINVSYYLNLYSKQKDLHKQVYWLINVWTEAAEYVKNMEYQGGYKAYFIRKLGQYLRNKNYALIKATNNPDKLVSSTSDLDLITDRKTAQKIYRFAQEESGIYKVQVTRQPHMNTLELYFDDQNFLRIDLLFEIRRKNVVYLDAQKALKSAYVADNGWRYIPDSYSVQYIKGFYHLNHHDIPEKYIAYYQDHFPDIRTSNQKSYVRSLLKMPMNNLFRLSWNTLKYFLGILMQASRPKGFVITYSGVDGAGKTTIIDRFAHQLKTKYRKEVVILRHRPSLLPILSAWVYGKKEAEQKAAVQMPHQGTNSSKLGSFIRFGYYLFDYIVGQFYVYIKYISRGYIVLYDRYYFDFINDPKRSNIIINKKVSQFFYRFLLKPHFNFFLYAKPEAILKRKQELDAQTIDSLTTEYRRLFARYDRKYKHSRYFNIENTDIDTTIKIIEQAMLFNN
jgi:thymidylate kinase